MDRIVLALLVIIAIVSPTQAQNIASFPIQYSADRRYIVDQNGAPFPILGRTAWFVTSLSQADYQTFIDDTVARGHNGIEFHVINHDPRGNNPPFNGNGDKPFLNRLNGTSWDGSLTYSNINQQAPDFTTPNEPYWSHLDGILSYCEEKGILVFLFPAYAGFMGGDQGWMREMVANGPTRIGTYGAWIANRYRDRKNLVWMMGGDKGDFDAAENDVENALLNGLKSVSGQQSTYFSAEWNDGNAVDHPTFGSQMTLNGVYSHIGDVNTFGRSAYAHTPVEPAFLLEGPFDEEGLDGTGWNEDATPPIRRFEWWGWLSTIGGYLLGNGYVWPFNAPGWQEHLDSLGSQDMARLNAFIRSIRWYKLVPSGLNGMPNLITAGGSTVGATNYVAAAAVPDGTLLVAYIPPEHHGTITVNMTVMTDLSHARWFDPTSGIYTEIGSGIPNNTPRVFTPPGSNSSGENDWVLLVETPGIHIWGHAAYCSNPLSGAASDVTLTLTGDATSSVSTDGSGDYLFSSLVAGGTYTVTPAKPDRVPGSSGITTVDAIAVQRHLLGLALLSGCQLTAADVNRDGVIHTSDVIGIRRFFLGLNTGIASVGTYLFIPASRTYSGIVADQSNENFNSLVIGDVASPYVQ